MHRYLLVFWLAFGFTCVRGQFAPHFTDLIGLEDSLGQTHLFYRFYQESDDGFHEYRRNDIYHLDITNGSDTLFLESYSYQNGFGDIYAQEVMDITWKSTDPKDYIASGYVSETDPVIQIFLPDTTFSLFLGEGNNVEVSSEDPQRVYLGSRFLGGFLRSSDGGYVWETDDYGEPKVINAVINIRVSPFNKNVLLGFNLNSPSQFPDLVKSIDGGDSFYTVQPFFTGLSWQGAIYFTSDSLTLYAVSHSPYAIWQSVDAGENWQTVYTDSLPFGILPDPDNPELLYLWQGRHLRQSNNGGQTFTMYWELAGEILNLYKKSGSDWLFAAVADKIYRITPADTVVIKALNPLSIDEAPSPIPQVFALQQNYPNPFNPATNIAFDLPVGNWVTLTVYDLLGREVKTLVNEQKTPGRYLVKWDGTNSAGIPAASGVYLYRLKAGEFVQTRKMLLMR